MNAERTDLHRGANRSKWIGNTKGAIPPKNAPQGQDSCPPDLLAFVRCNTLGKSEAALGMDRAQINRLRKGYWPRDPRRTLAAWASYRASHATWRLRRVRQSDTHGAFVCDGAARYTAPLLPGLVNQQVLIAKVDDVLLCQTIAGQQGQAERFELIPLETQT